MRGENLSRAEAGNFLERAAQSCRYRRDKWRLRSLFWPLKVKPSTNLRAWPKQCGIARFSCDSRHDRFIDTAGTGSSRGKNFQRLDGGSFCHCRRRSARGEAWFACCDIALRQRRRARGAGRQHRRLT